MGQPTKEDWARIKVVVCDVDGVLTDGRVLYGPDGELAKSFYIRDGMGLRLLEAAGVRVGIITSEDSELVAKRAERLMLSAYRPGMKRKGAAFSSVINEFKATPIEAVFIGDDVNDAEAFDIAGISVAPADASDFALSRARFISSYPGGGGCVREVADKILSAKGLSPDELWTGIHS